MDIIDSIRPTRKQAVCFVLMYCFGGKVWIKRFRKAQSSVELILVLPIFMLMICFIMEIGLLAYQTILAHHAAYEALRIGSMIAGPPGGTREPHKKVYLRKDTIAKGEMEKVLQRFFPSKRAEIISLELQQTGFDPQTNYGHEHVDLVLELKYTAKLFFPGSGYYLSPRRDGTRPIKVKMRMPVEVPVFN